MISSLDIVTSAKNESANIDELHSRISKTLSGTSFTWRLIICDNGSTDDTWNKIEELSFRDSRVIGLRMSRDFGFEGAIEAAIQESNSDALVMMASDLQDPPEAIITLVEKFNEGFDHVYQIVSGRPGTGLARRLNSMLFYSIASRMSNGLIQPNSSIFRILSRDMVGQLKNMSERNRFVRALVMYLGYNSVGIPIERSPRTKERSKAGSRHVFRMALKGILSNSYGLLDLVGALGIAVSAGAIFLTLIFASIWIAFGVPFAGFGLITSVLLLGFGFTFLCLGIISQYMSLIYEEVKGRPNFIVMKTTKKNDD